MMRDRTLASVALLTCVLLAACSTTGTKPPPLAGPDRQEFLGTLNKWSFTGRVALSDGTDGGSGSLEWQQHDSDLKIDFRGALGRGAWTLVSAPGTAVLELGNGSIYEYPDATTLVSRHVGWQIPMTALPHWVRGLPAPGANARIESGENGLPVKLLQREWEISYDRWDLDSSPPMPVRMTASRDQYSFKLIVRRWNLHAVQ